MAYLAKEHQRNRILERKSASQIKQEVLGKEFVINKGVYNTGLDTGLMAEVVKIDKLETFLEIGCGCGAISIILAEKAKAGLGIDINPLAVKNAKENAKLLGVDNIEFRLGNVFEGITEKFDVILSNPPYSSYEARDNIEKMFWDTKDEMKTKFFSEIKDRLNKNGRIYLGWADFKDLDQDLPFKLAEKNGLKIIRSYEKKSRDGSYTFKVFLIKLKED